MGLVELDIVNQILLGFHEWLHAVESWIDTGRREEVEKNAGEYDFNKDRHTECYEVCFSLFK